MELWAISLIVIIVLVFFKWLVFIFTMPVVSRYMKQGLRTKKKKNVAIPCDSSSAKKCGLRNSYRQLKKNYIRYIIIQVGYIPSISLRHFLYRHVFKIHLGEKAIVHYGAEIRAPYFLEIGTGSIIGDKACLDARNGLVIGKNVNLSSNVSIYTEQHDHRDPYFNCNSDETFKVQIDDRAWIGPNVVILPRVHIGEGTVVAAGAVVTKNLDPYGIYGGVPAKKIGERNRNLNYEFDGKGAFFY